MGKQSKVLVVDDDQFALRGIARALERPMTGIPGFTIWEMISKDNTSMPATITAPAVVMGDVPPRVGKEEAWMGIPHRQDCRMTSMSIDFN